jgi:hypothetical protein
MTVRPSSAPLANLLVAACVLLVSAGCGPAGCDPSVADDDADDDTDGGSDDDIVDAGPDDEVDAGPDDGVDAGPDDEVDAGPDDGTVVCGDGVRTGDETCDGSDVGGATCASLGFTGGDLACATGCDEFVVLGCALPVCEPNPCTEPNRGRCEPFGASFLCSCDEGFTELDGVCVDAVAALCADAHVDGDVWEPDECFELATPLVVGITQGHTLSPQGDVDWLRFDAHARTTQRLAVAVTPPSSAIVVEVLDADFVRVALLGRGQGELFVDSLRDEPLYVRVTGEGAYDLTLTVVPDDHGDDGATASPLTVDTPTDGAIEYPRDADWFVVGCAAGDLLIVRLEGDSSPFGSVLDPDGINIDNGAPILVTPCAADGPHFVRVVGGVDDYRVTVERTRDAAVDTCTPATPPFELDDGFVGRLELSIDRDCGRFESTPGTIYRLTIDADAPVTSQVAVPDARFIERIAAGAERAVYKLPGGLTCVCTGGVTALDVRYAIAVAEVGVDDHGDVPEQATVLVPDEPQPVVLDFIKDVDFFRCDLTAGRRYLVQFVGDNGGSISVSSGYNPDALAFFNVFEPPVDASIYVRVRDPGFDYSGTVVVHDLGPTP